MDAPPASAPVIRVRAPRIRVQAGGHVVIALTLVLGVLAALTGQNVLALLVALLLAFQLVCGMRSIGGLRGLVLEVEVPPAVDVGGVAHAVVTVSRRGRGRRAYGLELEALFGPQRANATQGAGALGGGYATVARLEGGASARVLVPLRGVLRGPATIVGWRVSSAYPSDLFRRTARTVAWSADVLVGPALRTASWPTSASGARARGEPTVAARRVLVRVGDTRGLRPWRDGDDARAIAWRATAKQGRLLVKEEDLLSDHAVSVVVARRPSAGVAADELADARDDDAEVALALVRGAVAAGRPVELCLPGHEVPIAVTSLRGLSVARDALARLAPTDATPVAPVASPGRDCLVVGVGLTPPVSANARVAPFPWVEPAPPRPSRRARVRAGDASAVVPDEAAATTAAVFEPSRRPLRVVQGAWALALGVGLVLVADPLAGTPLIAAGLASLVWGRRAEPLALRARGRAVLLVAAVAYAFLPGGEGLHAMSRFLAALTVSMMIRRRTPGEDGVVLALLLAQTGLLALLTRSAVAAVGAVAASLLGNRGAGAWHVLRRHERRRRRSGSAVGTEDPRATRRAADRAAIATLVLAVPLFALLPRADANPLALPGRTSAPEPGIPESIRLGGFVGVASGEDRVGMAQPINSAARDREPYFRVAAWETFDGVRWTSDRTERTLHGRYDDRTGQLALPGRDVDPAGSRFRVHVEPAAGDRLPVPEGAAHLTFAEPRPERVSLATGGALRPQRRGDAGRWAFESVQGRTSRSPYDEPTRAHLARPPSSITALLRPEVTRALEGVHGREARARRLALWVSTRARYALDVQLDRASPVVDFLARTRAGHCELFATVLVLALRLDGVPSRLVGGYHASLWNGADDFWVLRRRDAHAWTEAWIDGVGWLRLDGTPPDGRPRHAYEGVLGALAQWRDALRFAWNRHVLGFDAARQQSLVATLHEVARQGLHHARRAPWLSGLAVVGVVSAFLVARVVRRRAVRQPMRVETGPGADRPLAGVRATEAYTTALAALARRGWPRLPGETPRAFAGRVGPRLAPDATAVLSALTHAHERARFAAGDDLTPELAARWLTSLASIPMRGPA